MVQIKRVDGVVLHDFPVDTLEGMDLRGVDFSYAEIRGISFLASNLTGANFTGSRLKEVNFTGASLSGAVFRNAMVWDCCFNQISAPKLYLPGIEAHNSEFTGAYMPQSEWGGGNLRKCDFSFATLTSSEMAGDFTGSKFYRANLLNAQLEDSDLDDVDFTKANLKGTVLDPDAPTNQGAGVQFEVDSDGYCWGYLSQPDHIFVEKKTYIVGREYESPWFSVGETEWHPGLMIYPSLSSIASQEGAHLGGETVKVRFKKEDAHKAGVVLRVKSFEVVGIYSAEEVAEMVKDLNV